ncbi:hypothetical protein GCM10009687_38180 [Asanoa iriomotensis]|uniref:Uncharacterized protein n=1 Tax=Asanoa iriomotensis TaxID=234613 RepID=A0ABQ4CBQ9_9ACTN|nr:hypothetical protein Air01nite_58500 [Asanoa iriomotensis]
MQRGLDLADDLLDGVLAGVGVGEVALFEGGLELGRGQVGHRGFLTGEGETGGNEKPPAETRGSVVSRTREKAERISARQTTHRSPGGS